MEVVFVAGGVGIPGLYVVHDPGAPNDDSKQGILKVRFGKGWSKSLHFHTGQAPVLQYNRQLMQAILHGRLPIANIVNATVISLDDAPRAIRISIKVRRKSSSSTLTASVGKKAA